MTLRQQFIRWRWKVRRAIATFVVEALYGEDLMWDDADPEAPIYSIEEWAHDNLCTGETSIVTFQRAFALPTHTFEIAASPDPDADDINYTITRIHPKKKVPQ